MGRATLRLSGDDRSKLLECRNALVARLLGAPVQSALSLGDCCYPSTIRRAGAAPMTPKGLIHAFGAQLSFDNNLCCPEKYTGLRLGPRCLDDQAAGRKR